MLNGPGGPWRFHVEVKRLGEKPTPDQEAWHADERAAGGTVFVCDSLESFLGALTAVGFHDAADPDVTYTPTTKADSETAIQTRIKSVATFHGFKVSDYSQGYRGGRRRNRSTRQTKGIPDLYLTRARRDA